MKPTMYRQNIGKKLSIQFRKNSWLIYYFRENFISCPRLKLDRNEEKKIKEKKQRER